MKDIKIVPEIVDAIADSVKIQCDNELDKLAIYNIFMARFASVVGSKNIMTDSVKNIAPFPVAYYGLNLLASGGNKNKPFKAIHKMFSWIDTEYELKNESVKNDTMRKLINKLPADKQNDDKEIMRIENKCSNLPKLKSRLNGATSQKIYAICEQIAHSNFGSVFVYDTEFIKKFENKISGKTGDESLDMTYNLFDGDVDYTDTVLTDRHDISGISCSVCYASDYSRLLKNQKTNSEFRNYLQDGFARRIYLYTAVNLNGLQENIDYPTIEEIENAKNMIPYFSAYLKNIYDKIQNSSVYCFSREANILIDKYNIETKKRIKQEFSYASVICDDDEILKADLNGSAWKISKTAFLFSIIENPSCLEVDASCVQMAINYYNEYQKFLKYFLHRKSLDGLDKIKNYILKNLDETIIKTDFRIEMGIHHTKSVEFFKTTFPQVVDDLLTENIYLQEFKEGRKDAFKFYRKEL